MLCLNSNFNNYTSDFLKPFTLRLYLNKKDRDRVSKSHICEKHLYTEIVLKKRMARKTYLNYKK